MSSSREDILKRIDAAKLGMDAPAPARNYETTSQLSQDELINLLEDRIIDYKATFTRTTDVAATIAASLSLPFSRNSVSRTRSKLDHVS